MNLPIFQPAQDPGPNFAELLKRSGIMSPTLPTATHEQKIPPTEFRHGTTCVALRFSEGVLLAGDRRATSGHLISHRSIEKVFPADKYSGIAIAGAAGPAAEMVRLFQLQLEHYEKVEAQTLSLEGKANQLAQMVRSNLPAAMQGLVVVPIFAGYDMQEGMGRLFEYDVTGGKYEDTEYATTGSGSFHAGTVLKLGFDPNADAATATDLAISALYEAAEEDSATGGPDPIRGIYPIVATITKHGYERTAQSELAERTSTLIKHRRV